MSTHKDQEDELDKWKPIFVNGVIPSEFQVWLKDQRDKAINQALEWVDKEVIGKDDNIGIDPDWPWSKSAHNDKLRAQQRKLLQDKRKSLTN